MLFLKPQSLAVLLSLSATAAHQQFYALATDQHHFQLNLIVTRFDLMIVRSKVFTSIALATVAQTSSSKFCPS